MTANRPNVLWITTHDINPHLGSYAGIFPGAEYAHTPNLDRLASEGVQYNFAYSTTPVCAPSRSAIITGCFPTSIGTMHMRANAVPPAEVKLLPEYFRAAGYYTTNNYFTDFQVVTPATAFDDCSDTGHWRNRKDKDQPFFAAFQGMITHESQIYLDDEAFFKRTSHVTDDQRHDLATAPLPPYYPDTEVFRKAWARYNDLITEMDWEVGQILAQLEEDGLAENTIVVFWSEHGLGMPRGKRWATESGLREPLIVRWPGKIAANTKNDDLVYVMDLAPTMLRAAGLPVPEHMQSKLLFEADGQLMEPQHEYVFGGRDRMDEQEDTCRTVRDARFRLIHNYHPDRSSMQYLDYADHLDTWREMRQLYLKESHQLAAGVPRTILTPLQRSILSPDLRTEYELYDMIADPHETVNLAGDPAYADTLQRLKDAIAGWQAKYGDMGLIAEDDLVASWRPEGKSQVSGTPISTVTAGSIELTCTTDGSSIGWTTVSPDVELRAIPPIVERFSMPYDGRQWQLYTQPLKLEPGTTIYARSWRLGFDKSEEVAVEAQ